MTRAPCIVPGCRNTSAKFAGHRYICGPHWRLVPKRLKRRDRMILRVLVKRGEIVPVGKGYYQPTALTERGRRITLASWKLIERAAIEAGAGI